MPNEMNNLLRSTWACIQPGKLRPYRCISVCKRHTHLADCGPESGFDICT